MPSNIPLKWIKSSSLEIKCRIVRMEVDYSS